MERRDPTQKALVLAGGGARGSYQVGRIIFFDKIFTLNSVCTKSTC